MVFSTTMKVKLMPCDIESAEKQVEFWKEVIHEERERERLSSHSSVMLQRLQDGLSRSEKKLRKLQEK